ncbi:autotransporter domain-containing protein [Sinorhizobium meliloti]|uniref:Autotransporter domain-containing protein n=1 Tax=Rhizobium meliloti (strain 1021) TaxID=266834 RepID=B2FDD9_RHIME|nr:autotransporter outer membrane beta-barrel domain-containing protein [Sinorhizobium meliloti]AGG72448.1 Hypothetical protein SM2011_b22016 [Sinorhizobium meliloti 2011]MCM5688208.1 autotransporter outer membrane beta-barrel domain-containing protein [Sinorhizobium meliloti]MCO6423569.1 autotransporter outer membrane beta-barrel domain-containing protein [Sinorhizobium meliloti]MDE4580787.1 autotransporter outer membrane beta-barrel domain-containing protein [Sinorhizobium meliloti]MDE458765
MGTSSRSGPDRRPARRRKPGSCWAVRCLYRTSGSNGGNTLGRLQFEVGSIDLHASSIGAYWTHIGEDGWYVDSIGMYSWLDGGLSSDRGIGADTSGNSVAFSVEAGYPFRFDNGWMLGPGSM